MQAGQDSDGGVGGSEQMCTMQSVTVAYCVVVLALGDLVVWRHSVRRPRGAAQRFFIINLCLLARN